MLVVTKFTIFATLINLIQLNKEKNELTLLLNANDDREEYVA